MPLTRKLAAIMFTDIQGYTKLMQTSEGKALKIRQKHREVFEKVTAKNSGEIIQYYGDGTLSIFDSAVSAVHCACELQEQFMEEPVVPVRIGLHSGDIILEDNEIIGDSVNLASRVESLAVPGSVLVSEKVAQELKNQDEFETVFLGTFNLKNVATPMGVYAIRSGSLVIPEKKDMKGKLAPKKFNLYDFIKQNPWKAAILVFLILAGIFFLPDLGLNRPIDRLAVLPFTNRMNDPSQIHIVDGVHEELIDKLLEVGVKVKPKTSMLQYRESTKSAQDIAKELNVNALIEGSLIINGELITIEVRMIDGRSEEYLWSNSYEADITNIMSLYNHLTMGIANEIQFTLEPKVVNSLMSYSKVNPKAYELYLLGRYHINLGSVEDLDKAIGYFNEVIQLDPEFGPAYTSLVECYLLKGFISTQPQQAYSQFRRNAAKAMELDSGLQFNHHIMAMIEIFTEWDWKAAEEEILKAIEFDPTDWSIYDTYCQFLWAMGRTQESVEAGRKAVSADNNSHFAHCDLAWALYFDGQIDEAWNELEKLFHQFGNDCPYHNYLRYRILLDRDQDYQTVLEEINRFNDKNYGPYYGIVTMPGYIDAKYLNDEERAVEQIYELENKDYYVDPIHFAIIYVALNEYEKAIDFLEKAYDVRSFILLYVIKADPYFDPLRNYPRFIELLENMGLNDT